MHAPLQISRRRLFTRSGMALGGMALGSLLQESSAADPNGADLPHFRPTAKRVISLFMSGGPSHIDLLDYKPHLRRSHGQELPASVRGDQRLTGMTAGQKAYPVCGPIVDFRRYGHSGQWISDLLPHLGQVADELTIVKSMHTEAINHDPGITWMNTGSQIPGNPSMGAWLSYGLGSLNRNMPAYVVLISQGNGKNPGQPIFSRLWGSGFLPSSHQGVQLRSSDDPVLYLGNPPGISRTTRRSQLDALAALNQERLKQTGDPEISARIDQYEMAYRMQMAAPEIADLSQEPQSTFDLYGENARQPGTFAWNCVLARRMAERDVRFIQLFHRGWDQHNGLQTHLRAQCNDVDQPSAALLQDLKQRGLLHDTLVMWGGEFGRTAYSQGAIGSGRDHHGRCFSIWLAGGGIQEGQSYGETDDYSWNVAQNPVHVRDLHATALHCLGIDHRRFQFRFQGLDQRLTGVEESHVLHEILRNGADGLHVG